MPTEFNPDEYLTLEETHKLLSAVAKGSYKLWHILFERMEPNTTKRKPSPLVVERIMPIEDGLRDVMQLSRHLLKEIEQHEAIYQARVAPVPTGLTTPDAPEPAQEPASQAQRVLVVPEVRVRPAQRRMLAEMYDSEHGLYGPQGSNEKRTADALVAKGLADRLAKGNIKISDAGRAWYSEHVAHDHEHGDNA